MSVAGLAQGTRPGSGAWRRLAEGRTLPVMTVVLIILALWYAAGDRPQRARRSATG